MSGMVSNLMHVLNEIVVICATYTAFLFSAGFVNDAEDRDWFGHTSNLFNMAVMAINCTVLVLWLLGSVTLRMRSSYKRWSAKRRRIANTDE